MPMRRESGRAFGSGGKNRGPNRNPSKPTESRAQPPAYRLPSSAPRGDAPQTRQADFKRANVYKRTSAYERDKQAASDAAQAAYEKKMRERAPKEAAAQRKQIEQSRRVSLIKKILRTATGAGEAAANALTTPTPAERIQDRARTSPTRGVRRQVTRELSGDGELAKGLGKLAPILSQGGTPGEKVMASGFSGQAPGTRLLRATKAAGEDAVNLPATALPSLYVPADAAVQAARGNTKPAKKFIADVKQTDPIYAAVNAGVHLAKGDTQGAKREIERAGNLAEEHPGFTAVEVLGAKGAIGRGTGRGVRGTGRVLVKAGAKNTGERVRRVAATETRPDAVIPGTPLREVRTYSKDLTNKVAQIYAPIVGDRAKAKRAGKLRRQAERIEAAVDENLTPAERARGMVQGGQEEAAKLRRRAAELDPTRMSDKAVQRRIDLQEARAGNRQRNAKAERQAQAEKIVKSSGDKGAALNLVTQGIVRADVRDLRAYRDELAAAADRLGPAKAQQNRALREKINTSLERAERGGRLRRTDLEKVAQAARDYHHQLDAPLDARLVELGLLDREEAARSKLKSVAAREGAYVDRAHYEDHDGNRVSDAEVRSIRAQHGDEGVRSLIRRVPERFVDAQGRPLGTARLQALADKLDAPPSYLSQAPNMDRPGAYYETTSREPVTQGRARTGAAVREGTLNADRQMLVQSAVQRENFANAAESYRQNLSEIAVRDPKTKKATPVSFDDANRIAQDMTASTGTEYVPVSFEPWRASEQQREAMAQALQDVTDPQAFESLTGAMLEGLSGKQREGAFLVVPQAAASRMRAHLNVLSPGDLDRVLRQARKQWSTTVLSTSPSYVIGNVAEAGVRTAVNRAGPRSALTTRRVLARMRELDPAKADAFMNSVLTGGKFTLATRKGHLDPRSLQDSPVMRRRVARLQQAMKYPGIKQAAGVWHVWTGIVRELANGKVERGAQYAMAGRAMRDAGLTDELFKLSGKAIDDMARGLLDTAEQHRVANMVTDAFGNYSRFSPFQRRLIAEYSPFLAWVASSTRFLTRVLPRDHPLMMALLTVNERATADWREAMGLNDLPDYLKGGLTNRRNGRLWAVSRNTPFGAFSGNWAETIGDLFMPQALPAVDALRTGRDWRGYKLPDDTAYGRGAYAVSELAKSSIPAIAVWQKGRTYWQNPEKALSAIERPPYKPKRKLVKRKPGDLPALPDLGGGLDLPDVDLGGGLGGSGGGF
jgi:hypothetical protein